MRAGPVRYTHVDTLPGARGILVGIRGVATEDRSRMRVEAPPYGRPEIGRVRPGPGEVDAQVLDVRREGQLAGRSATSYQGVPPVKKPLWDWYLIPVYFWLGGIAGGSWLAAAAEAVAGRGDPGVFRAGRYLAFGGVAVGSGLLILDLGRPERFLNMLRVIRPRSPMSTGAWVVAGFGGVAGLSAALQAVGDGWLGERPALARQSRGAVGRGLLVAGLPLGLFLTGYTGVLLAATSVPAWAARRWVLGPLYAAAGVSSGLAAVSLALDLFSAGSEGARRRLRAARRASLGAELALEAASHRVVRGLPSVERRPASFRIARGLTVALGMATPLLLDALAARRPRTRRASPRASRRAALLSAGLTLAGGLALRLLDLAEGKRSADTPEDTWAFAGRAGRWAPVPAGPAVPVRGDGARPGRGRREERPDRQAAAPEAPGYGEGAGRAANGGERSGPAAASEALAMAERGRGGAGSRATSGLAAERADAVRPGRDSGGGTARESWPGPSAEGGRAG